MSSPWAMLMTPIKPKTIANPNDMIKRIELRLMPRKTVSITFDQKPQASISLIAMAEAWATVFCDSVASGPAPTSTKAFKAGTPFSLRSSPSLLAAVALTDGSSDASLSTDADSSMV